MVTTLYLIRHGQTENGEEKRYKGHLDVPLSKKGEKQMEEVSEYIVRTGSKLTAVYSSDLNRSVKSAEIVASPHSLSPIRIPSLRERNFGAWEGMSFEEIEKRYPGEFKAWAENPLEFSPVRGESTLEVEGRIIGAFNEIIENHNGEHIAIVVHGGTNRIILCHVLDIPLKNIFRIEQDYGAVNIIELWDNYPVVKLVNFTAYGWNQG